MTFEHVFDNVNFNYQANRVLSFGEAGCNREEVLQAMKQVTDVESWYKTRRAIAGKAREEGRFAHSMYYYRMAEFMLLDDRPEKDEMYDKMQQMFTHAFPEVTREKVPYKHGHLPCMRIGSPQAKRTILIHGGFDSFIEEFYLLAEQLASEQLNVILFEGEGQGETLRQHMHFHEKWEQSVSAVLDYYELDDVILMGISWGGYFALRAAAFEKRVSHVICHGVLYDALNVQQHLIPQPARTIFKVLYRFRRKEIINQLAYKKMQVDPLAEWGLTHGMYITGTTSPYKYLQAVEKHTLRNILKKIDQRVLLLTGEKDHYIPTWQYHFLRKNLPNATVDSRMFLESEGGEQHCQVGNYEVAIAHIKEWIAQLD